MQPFEIRLYQILVIINVYFIELCIHLLLIGLSYSKTVVLLVGDFKNSPFYHIFSGETEVFEHGTVTQYVVFEI
jgi:hypothetical protein